MSEGRGPRRSARIASKRQTTSEDESKPKRMKSDPPSRTPTLADSLDESLRNVFSLHEAIPVLNEYLSSIQIDDDNPGFVLSWDLNNLSAFVAAADGQNAARAPGWLQTRPPQITVNSFTDDLVRELHQVAGGRCGRVLLAPNTPDQFLAVGGTLMDLQNDDFMQDVARVALPVVNNVERYIVTTYNLTDPKAQRSRENNLQPSRRNNQRLRRIFSYFDAVDVRRESTTRIVALWLRLDK